MRHKSFSSVTQFYNSPDNVVPHLFGGSSLVQVLPLYPVELELRFLILFEDQQTSTQTRRLFLPAKSINNTVKERLLETESTASDGSEVY